MKTTICVVTGSRAEYGVLRPLLEKIKNCAEFELQLVATGMHLSPEFGLTYKEIEQDGFTIQDKVEMLLSSDTEVGIAKSTGLGIIGFSDTFSRSRPDLVIALGDRFEILSAVISAFFARIPVAHLYGGEVTEGAIDDAIRHSITKMSLLHFVSTEEYRRRVIQLGESPEVVFNVGALGIDNIKKIKLLTKSDLEADLKFKFTDKTVLVTFHPVTLEENTAKVQFEELLKALDIFKELKIIFTRPNADSGGRVIIRLIDDYVKNNEDKATVFTSMGQLRYLSSLQFVSAVVGNSSSGIIEAPSFGIPTINIGDRQKGRVRAESIIDCEPERMSIVNALEKAFSDELGEVCRRQKTPYGDGNASEMIINILKNKLASPMRLKKEFHNVRFV